MKTQSPLTTDERIARLESALDIILDASDGPDSQLVEVLEAVACEVRALRLTFRDEIREAAWRMSPSGQLFELMKNNPAPDPIASRKAPDPNASPFEQPPAPAGIPYGKDSEEAQAIERVIAEADAERKASDE